MTLRLTEAMSDYVEDGPSRRISRRRLCTSKKTGNCLPKRDIEKDKENEGMIVKVSPDKKSDWFCDSFSSNRQEKLKTSSTRDGQTVPISSTPKARRMTSTADRKSDVEALNTSDALLASLDLEDIQSQNQPNSKNSSAETHGNNSTNDLKSEKNCADDTLNTTATTQSQYFPSKFRNYVPTQEKQGLTNPDEHRKNEAVTGNFSTMKAVRNDTQFSFSFVGNDTALCDDEDEDSIVFGSPMKPPSRRETKRDYYLLNATRVCKPDVNKDNIEWCPSQFATSTQATGPDVKDTQVCTQQELHDMTQNATPCEADITQLKDKSMPVRYRCTPYKQQQQSTAHGRFTQGDTQTQTQCSVLEITSVVSQDDHYRSQHKNPTCLSISQEIYAGNESQIDDIQPTPICDMTGLIVDTQSQRKPGHDDSRCDEFDDSFHDPDLMSQIEKIDDAISQRSQSSQQTQNGGGGDLSSHTQSLNVAGKNVGRKRSLDDDIDEIFNASQKRRNVGKRSKSSSKSSKISDCSTRSIQSNTEEVRTNDQSEMNNACVNVGPKSTVIPSGDKTEVYCNTTLNSTTDKGKNLGLVTDSSVEYTSKGKGGNPNDKGDNSHGKAGPNPLDSVITNQPVGSLQDRIRQRLKYNAGQRTPKGPNTLIDQIREQVLERAQIEAHLVKESARNDVGPFYGLPSNVKGLFAQHRGITSLYAWQDECLTLPAVLNRKNLIYSLPTSGGKTLVAEILILQELLCQKRDALLILPFVSIVQEKVRNLSQFAVDLNFHVEEYAGSKGRFPPTKRRQSRSLFIATIEKAHSIINSLIEEDRMDSLGLVVVDELHMIGEGGSRGATMESTLIKLLHTAGPTQIIGMSATLNNIGDLQKFLNAEVYSNDFRPVQLTENIKVTDSIYRIDTAAKCTEDRFIHERVVCFQYKPEMEKTDPNHLLGLALEVIPDHSCLIFCPTKKNCESVALMLSKMLVKMKSDISSVRRSERKMLLKELYNDADGRLCPVLQYTLHFGIAYHHSGLTMDERKLIEEAYSAGVLSLLTCTSTLAAGVNLPAKRVILKSPYVGKNFISRSQYKQMVGRAGRAGIDTTGESILICQQSDREKVCELLDRPLEKCHSSLFYNGGKGIRNFLLSAIGLKIVTRTENVFRILERSLLSLQQTALNINLTQLVQECLQKLIDIGLIKQIRSQSEDPQSEEVVHSLEVTELGKATFKGPVDPDYACMLYEDLKKDECLVISTHLHLLYLVTPYDLVEDINPSWMIYHNQMSTLSAAELKVASIIGVPESYITMKASMQRSRKKVNDFVVKRFYLTLMLYELWCQKTVWEVAEKFELHRGFIQSLLSSAASFASCVSHFCQEMSEFWAYQDLMGNFVKRLSYCVTAELIPLMEIPGVKLGRARLMYNAGYRTLSSVATCDVEQLVKNIHFMPRKVAKQIIASAKLLLNEKAEAMMEEVEDLVAIPQGLTKDNTTLNVPTPMPVTPGHSQNSLESQEN